MRTIVAFCAFLATAIAVDEPKEIMPGLYPDAITYNPASNYAPYQSKLSDTSDAESWIQIDVGDGLASVKTIELYPVVQSHGSTINLPYLTYGFPLRYKIEASNDESLSNPVTLVDATGEDQPNPHDTIITLEPKKKLENDARYIRLTATKLGPTPDGQHSLLAMMKIAVLNSDGDDVAVNKEVTVDSTLGNQGRVGAQGGFNFDAPITDSASITRKPRPEGEGIVKNNPDNVIKETDWNPPDVLAHVPTTGVKLNDGVFKDAMKDNIGYLLNNTMSTVDHLVQDFRQRAGKSYPNVTFPDHYWAELPGSNAGRWLMGASNTLRWLENDELRSRWESVMEVISECAEDDGYMVGYSKDSMFLGEHAAYSRSMLTHGILDSAITGQGKAYDILRNFYDWYNKYEHLDKLQRGTVQGQQGMVANTRVAKSEIGSPEDVYVIQQYFQENYWRKGLADEDTEMIWQYPYDRPHNYLATALEPYLDLYMLTGSKEYLDMTMGYWNMIRKHWMFPGGVMSITEFGDYPPDSLYLDRDLGETCGNSFWVRINQRLHQLDPDEEAYAAEIERSIYNLFLPNQDGDIGILYHTRMEGQREDNQHTDAPFGEHINTCCEGQGTRTYGSLPEFIFSAAKDGGLYVNLFESAEITWSMGDVSATMSMASEFPFGKDVVLKMVDIDEPQKANIRVRIPSWFTREATISVNGHKIATGKPGSYANIERKWSKGDTISFKIPVEYGLTEYTGATQIDGHKRYAIQYGPVLMALSGAPSNATLSASGDKPEDLFQKLKSVDGKPLHSSIDGSNYTLIPYFHVQREDFTCFPVIDIS